MTLNSVASQTSLRQEVQRNPAATLWSLTRTNLYLVWRRAMTPMLAGIFVLLFALQAGFLALIYNQLLTSQRDCTANSTRCQGVPPAVLDQAVKVYQGFITFPTSLGVGGGNAGFIGALLVAIIAGTVVGNEFGAGTLRLSLARGLSRASILAGQVLAFVVVALITAAVALGAGALLGVTIGPSFGLSISSVPLEGLGEIGVYGLAVALNVLLYALVAQFFAVLGRSTAAGIGGGLAVLFLEFLVNTIFGVLQESGVFTGDWGERLKHIPDWFPGNSVGALATHAGTAPIAMTRVTPTTIDLTQAAIVTAVYVIALIGGSYALFRVRDVTD